MYLSQQHSELGIRTPILLIRRSRLRKVSLFSQVRAAGGSKAGAPVHGTAAHCARCHGDHLGLPECLAAEES